MIPVTKEEAHNSLREFRKVFKFPNVEGTTFCNIVQDSGGSYAICIGFSTLEFSEQAALPQRFQDLEVIRYVSGPVDENHGPFEGPSLQPLDFNYYYNNRSKG